MSPFVLVLTNRADYSADFVIRELQERGVSHFRLNTEDLPRMRISWSTSDNGLCLATAIGTGFNSSDVDSVWYRRPGKPFGDAATPGSEDDLLNRQWRALIDGLLTLPNIRWINHPVKNSLAETKIVQMRLARSLGLKVPRTLISNDSVAIMAWLARLGSEAVVKALDAPLLSTSEGEAFVYTTLAEADLFRDPAAVRSAPVIVQERIAPKTDIRVTVVGNRLFPAEARHVTELDWRKESHPVEFVATSLPRGVASNCSALVRELGLTFGAIDLLKRDREYYFLEVNPNGEWGFLQVAGFNISSALVEELCLEYAT